uniref:Uncharacterized protein n=2 Tax=viral metagenome TaxID=1070528 RepID=A0A6M3JS09_9ZZZZ
MKFRARLEKGRLVYQRELVQAYLSRFKEGDVFKCDITRPQKIGSDPLRKYYFASCLPIFMKEIGYEPHEKNMFHEQLKMLYFDPQPDKHGFRRVPSLFRKKAKKPTKEQYEFVEWVKRLAAQQDIYLPDPNE